MKRLVTIAALALVWTTSFNAQSLPAGVMWRIKLPAQPQMPPVIAPDGRILTYVQGRGAGVAQLVVLAPNGARQLSVARPNGLVGLPVIAPNGTIYSLGNAGRVDAIAPDGRTLWSYVVSNGGRSDHRLTWPEMAVRHSDSAVFVAGRCVYAFASTGARLWRTCLDERARAARYEDNSLFVRSGERLFRLNRDGKVLWSAYVGPGATAPAFDSNGLAYVASGGLVTAIAITAGTTAWTSSMPQEIVALGWSRSAKLIVVQERRLDVVGNDGQARWHTPGDADLFAGPVAIAPNGDFYVGGSVVRRYGPDGIINSWKLSQYNMFAPAVSADARLLVMGDVSEVLQAVPLPE